MTHALPKARTMGLDLSVGTFREHVDLIADWGAERRSAYVCCVNVHMCMTAHGDPSFTQVVNQADLATADGMPMLNSLNRRHALHQERVAGNDLMPAVMAVAEQRGLSVFLLGGTQQTLDLIRSKAASDFPKLRIAGMWSPPFQPTAPVDPEEDVARIKSSGASIVLVSLGCPKQERWMASMRGKIPAVMLGVGGAFLLYAGQDRRAPKWMRDASLEWLFRLALEPGRLWKRYLVTNTSFMLLAVRERWFGKDV